MYLLLFYGRVIALIILEYISYRFFSFPEFLSVSLFATLWIAVYFCYKSFSRRYYLTRKFLNTEAHYLLLSVVVLLIAYVIYAVFISLEIYPKISLIMIHILSVIVIFLPYLIISIVSNFISKTIKNKNYFIFMKKIWPYHFFFRRAWSHSTDATFNIFLLSIEVDAVKFDERLFDIVAVWFQLNIISPLSFINKEKRGEYEYLYESLNSDNIRNKMPQAIDIESYTINDNSISIILSTSGNLILSDLASGKVKSKLSEIYSRNLKILRSLSFNDGDRSIILQFFTLPSNFDEYVIGIIKNLDRSFTNLEIKNLISEYPYLTEVNVLDSDEKGLIYSISIKYHLPQGISTDIFNDQKIAEIASYVRRPIYKHKIKQHEDCIEFFIEINKRDLSKLSYKDFPPAQGLRVPIGFDLIYRRTVFMNFNPNNVKPEDHGVMPHYIISGTTGCGKSSFIKYLILQLMRGNTPDTLRFFLIDPKVVSFSTFKNNPFLYAPIISDAVKFKIVLKGIINEVERRYKLLAKYNVERLSFLEKVAPEIGKKIPRIIVIVDEFADIIDSHNYKNKEEINLLLKKLGQKARAAGIHLVLITQRATSVNIDSEIKANLGGRVIFKVASEGDSQVLIESPVASQIENRGEGYAKLGDNDELVHFQSPFVTKEEMDEELLNFNKWKLEYIDKSLADDLLREPLSMEEVNFGMLGQAKFPLIPVGINLKTHEKIYLNFEKSDEIAADPTPHVLITGATNTGKSKFAKLILSELILSGSPNLVRIVLVDPKHVTFRKFVKSPHLACPIITKHNLLLPVLKDILKMIEDRYKLFAKHNCENIEEYRIIAEEKIPSYFVIIDEFADLLDYYPHNQRNEIENILKRYGQMARAAGVHLILLTQRATSQNVPSELRANLAGRISFRVNTEADSHFILEESGAEKLEHSGMFLVKKNDELVQEGYFPLMHGPEFEEIISESIKKYGEAKFDHLAEMVNREPLDISSVTTDMLPLPVYPFIPIGINLISHKVIYLCFSWNTIKKEDPTPHMLIVGATNTGKSVFAKLLVTQLMRAGNPDLVKLILIDPKQVTFQKFKQSPHLACPIVTKHAILLPVLKEILSEIEYRYKVFSEYNVENIEEFRAKTGKNLASYFLFIDEFADLLDYYPYNQRAEIENILKRYGQMARAAGIHMILITQRATSQNVPSELRANLAGRISFRVNTEADSHFILEESGAEKLEHTGEFYVKKNNGDSEKGYAPLFHGNDIQNILEACERQYGPAKYDHKLLGIVNEISK